MQFSFGIAFATNNAILKPIWTLLNHNIIILIIEKEICICIEFEPPQIVYTYLIFKLYVLKGFKSFIYN